MEQKPLRFLFTSAGRRAYLIRYFQEALKGNGRVYAANSSPVSTALEAADEGVVTPLIYDDGYIPFLLDYCRKHQIDALMSLFDIDLPVLARHKADFAAVGTRVLVSDPELVDVCNDKWKTCQFLRDNGFPLIPTWLDPEEALAAVRRGEVSFPLIVKPRWGMGSLSIFTADSEEELRVFYEKVRREIFRSYLKYESAFEPERCVLIQKRMEGQEYGLDNIDDLEGRYVTTVLRKKLAMRSGETDCAEIVEDPQLLALARRLAGLTRHVGVMDLDLIVSDGIPYILEMNARFGGGYPFSHLAGVNMPAAITAWLRGEEADPAFFRPRIGVVGQKDIVLLELSRKNE
jgi:carbamoyl-phosphate synthase large subunit